MDKTKNSFDDLTAKYASIDAPEDHVRNRGRPKTPPEVAETREKRRAEFGDKLRMLREKQNLTIAAAARKSGISSSRKLSQYETTCYPPGWVVRALAPIYRVSEAYLADLVLKHSDPEMYRAMRKTKQPKTKEV